MRKKTCTSTFTLGSEMMLDILRRSSVKPQKTSSSPSAKFPWLSQSSQNTNPNKTSAQSNIHLKTYSNHIMPVLPGNVAPSLELPSVNGNTFKLSESNPDLFTIVVFYRGAHCPLCINYAVEIEEKLSAIHDAGMQIVLVSMDNKDRATEFATAVATKMGKNSLEVPILYNLTQEQASEDWGLYLSSKIPGSSEPDVFSEPGLFVVRSDDKTVFMAQTQSAPFTRPSMDQLVGGLSYAAQHHYPTRGTHVTETSQKDADLAVEKVTEDPVSTNSQ